MSRPEAAAILAGGCAIVIALTAVDWRLGLFALGIGLIAAAIDYRRLA
jgi:type IV secretory pathway TrbD component